MHTKNYYCQFRDKIIFQYHFLGISTKSQSIEFSNIINVYRYDKTVDFDKSIEEMYAEQSKARKFLD